jgi:hypothetical protein
MDNHLDYKKIIVEDSKRSDELAHSFSSDADNNRDLPFITVKLTTWGFAPKSSYQNQFVYIN